MTPTYGQHPNSMGPFTSRTPFLQTSNDNRDLQPSQSRNHRPTEESRWSCFDGRPKEFFNRVKRVCRRGDDSRTRDLVHETVQHARTSVSEEDSGREPYAYSGYVNGVATASASDGAPPARLETTRMAYDTAAGPQAGDVPGNQNPTENDSDGLGRPFPTLSSSPTEHIILAKPSELRTTCKMIFHMQGDRSITRLFQLDTGSSVDLISQLVTMDLGVDPEPCEGQVIPLGDGEPIQPLGKVTLEWHVRGKPKTYKTTFLVLDPESSKDFDVLLGRETISRVGFYKTDDKVWVLNLGSR